MRTADRGFDHAPGIRRIDPSNQLHIVIVLIVFPLGLVDAGRFWSTVFSVWFGMAFYLLMLVSVSLVIVRRRRETTS